MDNLLLRKYCKEDKNFILNSWLKSARNTPEFTNISNDVYFKNYADHISNILDKPETCFVLCPADDQDLIYGYIVIERPKKLVHYVYLKYSFRKFGLAKKLFEVTESDWEATSYNQRNKHIYNPFKRGI